MDNYGMQSQAAEINRIADEQHSVQNRCFNVQYGIGHAKYVVNFHNGFKTYPDGSPFFDVHIFKSKEMLNEFTKHLRELGYREGQMTETIAPSIFHADIKINTSTKYPGSYSVSIDGLGLSDLKAQYKELRAAVPYDADSQCLLDILQDVILEIEALRKD